MINFKNILICLISVLTTVSLTAEEKPNIVFILVDDMPWWGTSVAQEEGNPQSTSIFRITPNIERIAAKGMTFSNAYAAAGMCAPSRSSIQTGLSPARHLFSGNGNFGKDCPPEVHYEIKGKDKGRYLLEPSPLGSLNTKFTTIGKKLKEQGYATAHFGKWHCYGGGPGAHGYDEHNGETSNDEGKPTSGIDPKDPKRIFSITNESIGFIERQHKAKKPFYVQVSHYVEHNKQMSLDETLKEFLELDSIKSLDVERNRKETSTHGAAVKDLDTSIGMLLDKLEELKIRDNTYIVFTSDNGKGLYNGKDSILRGDKWWLWEAGIRVPLMIEGPGIAGGSRSRMNVVNYDFLPTFYDMAGGSTSKISHLDGKSLMPLLTQKDESGFIQRALYFHYPHLRNNTPHSAIIKGDYKLYTFYEIPDQPYLYKLKNDLGEETNLTLQMPEKAQELKKELNDYLVRVNAYFPKENPTADTSKERFNPDKMMPALSKIIPLEPKKKKKKSTKE